MSLEEIFTFENLYNAHKSSRCTKQHLKEIITFELNLSFNIYNIIKKLTNKTYKLGKYKSFYIYEPKRRLIEALPYKDRVVIKCFCENSIIPKMQKRLINDNVACQKNKGTLYGVMRLENHIKKEYVKKGNNDIYFLKCDIKKYFQSINHDILLSLLKTCNFNKDEMWFIEKLVKEQPENLATGLPLGNQSSQWFALYYLNGVDHYIKEILRIKGYVRYMDDMILIHPDKAYLRYCKKEIERMCNDNLKLELNQKTQIGKLSNGIDFLGYRHILTSSGKVVRKLRKSSKIRLKKHLKILYKLHKKNIIDNNYVLVRVNSFYSHVIYTKENIIKNNLHSMTIY